MHRRALLMGIAGAVALTGCSPAGESDQTPPTDGTRAIIDPAAVIRPLYDRYLTHDAQFPEFREQAPWSGAMWAEISAMTARSEALNEPILDFDPLIGAQDYQLSDLNVANESIAEGSHAVVRATFNNASTRTEIVYDLIWEDDRWKVDNIRGEGWDMRQIVAAPNADAIAP